MEEITFEFNWTFDENDSDWDIDTVKRDIEGFAECKIIEIKTPKPGRRRRGGRGPDPPAGLWKISSVSLLSVPGTLTPRSPSMGRRCGTMRSTPSAKRSDKRSCTGS